MSALSQILPLFEIGTRRVRLVLLGLALALAVSSYLWIATPANADEGNIQVVQVGAESRYPQGVRFFVTASSPDEINEIRLFFKKTGRVTASAYRALEFDSGDLVNAESILSTGAGLNYMPPGTEISYFFEIRDEAGSVHRTPDQKIVYSDSRFDWQILSSGPIIVYHYGQNSEERAQMALEAAIEAMARMAPVLGFDPSEPIRIVSYSTYGDMLAALPLRQQIIAGHVQTEGMAFGDERVVLIRGFDPMVRGITSHEITHLAVAEVTGRAKIRIPAWLDEGLAEYGNIEPSPVYEEALRQSITLDQVRPLRTLASFSGDANRIMTAYGQGRAVVGYLISTYGTARIAELMQAIRRDLNIDQALERVYGFDQWGLDNKWRKSMGLDPLPRPEEPEPRLLPSPTPTRTPVPTPTRAAPSPTPAPTPEPSATFTPAPTATSQPTLTPLQPTPAPEPTSAASVEDEGGVRQSPGCSIQQLSRSGPLSGDLALIAILAAPMAMLLFRGRRRS